MGRYQEQDTETDIEEMLRMPEKFTSDKNFWSEAEYWNAKAPEDPRSISSGIEHRVVLISS